MVGSGRRRFRSGFGVRHADAGVAACGGACRLSGVLLSSACCCTRAVAAGIWLGGAASWVKPRLVSKKIHTIPITSILRYMYEVLNTVEKITN